MSKLTDSFKTAGVFNTHGFYQGRPYIWYRPTGMSRSMIYAAWMISPPKGKQFKGHWMDNGCKSFEVLIAPGETHNQRRRSSFLQAQEYATRVLKITEWEKDPYGSYGEATFVLERIAELKQLAAKVGA